MAIRFNFVSNGPADIMSKLIAQLKKIIMFLLSPLFALGYMALFPVVALGMLLKGNKGEPEGSGRVS